MLNGIPLFSWLTESEKSTIALFAQERKINSGTLLFSENDDATAMYIVKEGKLKIYKDRSSWEIPLGFIEPGEMVGEMALFDNTAPKKRFASVKAVEDTFVVVIVDYAIVELSRKHPIVYAKIQQVIQDRNIANIAKRQAGS